MGTSSSKSSTKRFNANRERQFLSASVNLPSQIVSTIPTKQTSERGPFLNHPIYLPPPTPLSQKQQHLSNQLVSSQHAASWRAYDLDSAADAYSPIANYHELHKQYDNFDEIKRQQQTGIDHVNRKQRQQAARLRHARGHGHKQSSSHNGGGPAPISSGEHEEAATVAPGSTRLKGTPASAAPQARKRRAAAAGATNGANVTLSGTTKQQQQQQQRRRQDGAAAAPTRGKRNRFLVPPARGSPSSSLSRTESLGSRLDDLCSCAECRLAESAHEARHSPEACQYCDALQWSADEGAHSRLVGDEHEADGQRHHHHHHHNHDYHRGGGDHGAFVTSFETAALDERRGENAQHFQPVPLTTAPRLGKLTRLQRQRERELERRRMQLRFGGSTIDNIAPVGEVDYRVAAASRREQVLQSRRRNKALELLVGREERGESTLAGQNLTLQLAREKEEEEDQEEEEEEAQPYNLSNDETTTCSVESASDLHHSKHLQKQQPTTTASISDSGSYSHMHRALRAAVAAVAEQRITATQTRKTTKTTANSMASATTTTSKLFGSGSSGGGCKHSTNGTNATAQTANMSSVPAHKKPSLERGLAMNEESRKRHGLLGLLPAAVQDQSLQARAIMNYIDNCKDELSKYVYLRHLKDFNEKLFYYTLTNNVQQLMPLVYTPTVGLACQKFSEIYMRPRGMFITANDAGRVRQIIANWPERDVRVIVVTDGERILGLGDLGANGMGISIGKLSLYTALAGIPPQNVLPITIDVGTENQVNIKDPFYIGLRQARVRGEKYEALIDEFMQAVVERWGRSCLIQFEDFGNSTAFNLLKRYHDKYCTFNDDIQGTASVSLSGLISAAKLTGKRLSDCTFLFYGAGEANLGTAQLLIMAMIEDGLKKDEAKQRIWLVDSKGLVVDSRQDLSSHKREFARSAEPLKDLESIIDFTKPAAIVGASAQGGSFSEAICKKMATYNERPIIFALSNPTSKAECTAEQAYKWTAGKCVFASGSPFEPVEYEGKTYITGQGNNAYIFPGVGLAAIGAHTHTIPNEAFLVAARALSDQVTASDTEIGLVYPRLTKIREVTLKVAARVLEHLFSERLATYRPEPSDKLEFLRGIQYDPSY